MLVTLSLTAWWFQHQIWFERLTVVCPCVCFGLHVYAGGNIFIRESQKPKNILWQALQNSQPSNQGTDYAMCVRGNGRVQSLKAGPTTNISNIAPADILWTRPNPPGGNADAPYRLVIDVSFIWGMWGGLSCAQGVFHASISTTQTSGTCHRYMATRQPGLISCKSLL
jgi:hypothetical protein